MKRPSLQRLEYLCEIIPALLRSIPEEQFAFKPLPEKWSKKEILGHIADSATNNHHRFVRSQFEDVPTIIYDQDNWNRFGYHQQIETSQLIDFWTIYNKQIVAVYSHIPERSLDRECIGGVQGRVTLRELMDNYVEHLEHHLKQIVSYQ